MNELGLAALFALFAAVTVWGEHYMLPDWYPSGYSVIWTYLLGSSTVFVYGLFWAMLTGNITAAIAFFLIGVGAGLSIVAAYRRDYVIAERRKAAEAAQAAQQAAEAQAMAAFLADQEGER